MSLALTYSAHAVTWAVAAALLARRRSQSSARRHLYWKVSLFGPLLTALLTVALPARIEAALAGGQYFREITIAPFAIAARVPAPAEQRGSVAASGLEADGAAVRKLGSGFVACGFAGAALGFLRFAGSMLLLGRRLRGRKLVRDPRLLERLERVRARTGVRRVIFSQHDDIVSPLVIGRNEVCIPAGLLESFADAEVDNVIAHELAHLERGDGLWFPAAAMVQSVLWLHPINHWVASRFRRSAELACDDRAVELTCDPLALARALVRVAGAAPPFGPRTMLPLMAHSRSTLVTRVTRLTTPDPATFVSRPRARAAMPELVAIGLALGLSSFRPLQVRSLPPGAAETQVKTEEQQHARESPPSALPDPRVVSEHIAELERRAREVEAELAATRNFLREEQEGTAPAVRVLELSQELDHLRATENWLEQRFVHESSHWQEQTPAERAAH